MQDNLGRREYMHTITPLLICKIQEEMSLKLATIEVSFMLAMLAKYFLRLGFKGIIINHAIPKHSHLLGILAFKMFN
jgi:hypothetical protein